MKKYQTKREVVEAVHLSDTDGITKLAGQMPERMRVVSVTDNGTTGVAEARVLGTNSIASIGRSPCIDKWLIFRGEEVEAMPDREFEKLFKPVQEKRDDGDNPENWSRYGCLLRGVINPMDFEVTLNGTTYRLHTTQATSKDGGPIAPPFIKAHGKVYGLRDDLAFCE